MPSSLLLLLLLTTLPADSASLSPVPEHEVPPQPLVFYPFSTACVLPVWGIFGHNLLRFRSLDPFYSRHLPPPPKRRGSSCRFIFQTSCVLINNYAIFSGSLLTAKESKPAVICGKTRQGSSFQAPTKEFCWLTGSRQHLQWKQLIVAFKKTWTWD